MARSDANARVAVLRARQLLREQRYADALQVCTDELARGADDPQLRLVAAHSLLAQGRHEGARKEADQVLRLDPNHPEAYRILADVACARGETTVAREKLERVLELDPADDESRAMLETIVNDGKTSGLDLSLRATSLDRFIDEEMVELDAEDLEEASSPGERLPITDSMIEELPELAVDAKPPSPGLATLHDQSGDTAPVPQRESTPADDSANWQPDEGSAPSEPAFPGIPPSGLDDLPDEEDAPTMPLLRPSAPKEPQLKLDPLASRPVRPVAGEPGLGGSTQPVSPDQILGQLVGEPVADAEPAPKQPAPATGGTFEDFGDLDGAVEDASVPLPRPAAQPIPEEQADPRPARARRPSEPTAAADPMAMIAGKREAQRSDTGRGLMDMLTGGAEHDDSSAELELPQDAGLGGDDEDDIRTGRVDRLSPSELAPQPEQESWDPLASAEARPEAEDSLVRELAAAGIAEPVRRRRGRGRLIAILVALVLLAGAGGYGYLRYRSYKYVQGQWQLLRGGVRRGTIAGLGVAKKAAERILTEKPSDPAATAAIAMCDAAMSIEYGEDRRKEAKKALERTKGHDSEWRTAARGFLSLIDDPTSAAGYLAKGTEVFPESALLQYLRGRALAAIDRQDDAAAAFRKASELVPEFMPARVALATLIGQQDKGYQLGLERLDAVLKRQADHVRALVERSRLRAHHNRELKSAAQDVRRVTSELRSKAGRGEIGWAHLVAAQIARRLGDVRQMEAALDDALRSPPCCDSAFFFAMAKELMGLFRLADASKQMAAALELKPKQPRYLQRMARILLEQGKPSAAAKYINRAPAGDPQTKVLSARQKVAAGQYKAGASALRQLQADEKTRAEATLALGLCLARQRKYAAALKELRQLAAKKPRSDRTQQALGRVHILAGRMAQAEAALQKAWGINKLDPATPVLLGRVSLAQNDFAKARARFLRALKSRPAYAPAHLALADLDLRLGRWAAARAQLKKIPADDEKLPAVTLLKARLATAEGALADAERLLATIETSATGHAVQRARGELALARGEGAKALGLLTKARRGGHADADLLVALARAQMLVKKVDDAYDTLHVALKRDSGHAGALLLLGRIAVRDGEIKLAHRRLASALKQARKRGLPKKVQAQILTATARAFLREKKNGRALSSLDRALEHDPKSVPALYHTARTWVRIEHPKKAIKFYLRAIALAPGHLAAHLGLGRAYAKAGDKANAVKYLQAYLDKAPKTKATAAVRRELVKLSR